MHNPTIKVDVKCISLFHSIFTIFKMFKMFRVEVEIYIICYNTHFMYNGAISEKIKLNLDFIQNKKYK
jgi:hypothetical protein